MQIFARGKTIFYYIYYILYYKVEIVIKKSDLLSVILLLEYHADSIDTQ